VDSILFDVFLSYNRADQAVIERVAQALYARGFKVFLDRWYLAPGRSWPEALEDALAHCRAVAVLLGADGLGPWQQREQYKALDRQAKEPGFLVVPVVLPNVKDQDLGLGFLGLNTWIDLRPDLGHGIELLAKALRGESVSPTEQGRDPRAEVCPFRGLQPFREEDAEFFCGREAFTRTLLERVASESLIAVVGASGSGKSSVIRAGLVPALRRGEDRKQVWDVALLRPGRDPLQALAAALLPPDPDLSEYRRIAELRDHAELLASGKVPLSDVVERILEKQPGTSRVLLVVDQAEELFTLTETVEHRRRFVELLLDATRRVPLTVALTLRGDFYGRALEDRVLADRLDHAVVNLGPMTRNELARAIREPAEKVRLGFEDGLVERILTDVGNAPGNLPLIEFLLEGLWQQRAGGCLTHRAYDALGGISGAIARRADNEFGRLTAEQQAAARRFLVRLVTPGEGREDTRAVAEVTEGDPLVASVVRHFADARLLVTDRDVSGQQELVEVSHEALIRSWTELRRWVDEDREFLRTLHRIEEAKRLWCAEGYKPDRLLQIGRPLSEAEELLEKRPDFVDRDLRAYIAASQSRARRAAKFRNLITMAAVALTIFALGAAAFSVYSWFDANEQKQLAQDELQQALRNQSHYLAGEARAALHAGNNELAEQISLEALPIDPAKPNRPMVQEAVSVLSEALAADALRAVLGHQAAVRSAAFSPPDDRVITASEDGTARIWNTKTGALIATLHHGGPLNGAVFDSSGGRVITSAGHTAKIWNAATGMEVMDFQHEAAVLSAAFSPSGDRVITTSADCTARIWDATTSAELASLRHDDRINFAAFSPSGDRVITASADHTARIWDAGTRATLITLHHDEPVLSAVFSASSDKIVTVTDHAARIWEAATGTETAILRHPDGAILSAQFSPVGDAMITTSKDNTARLWNAATGLEVKTFPHDGTVTAAGFSPSGKQIVTASRDGTARVWDAESGARIATYIHGGSVVTTSFSPSGDRIVTVSDDNAARLWDTHAGAALLSLRHDDMIKTAAFNPAGDRVITASRDGTARIWNAATGAALAVLQHEGPVNDAAFSPSGNRVVTASDDGTARIWDTQTGVRIAVLAHERKVRSARFNASGGRVVTASDDRTARIWNAVSGAPMAVFHHKDRVRLAVFSPAGDRVITACDDYTARIWNALTGRETLVLQHADRVETVAFSPLGDRVATASRDHTVRIWNAATGAMITTLAHRGTVKSIAFDASGKRVLTVSLNDTAARVWDANTGAQIEIFQHDGLVNSAAFSPSGDRLITASADKTARIWDAASGIELLILSHADGVGSDGFSPSGDHAITASADHTARIWNTRRAIDGPTLIDYARAATLRTLSSIERAKLFLGEDRPVEACKGDPWSHMRLADQSERGESSLDGALLHHAIAANLFTDLHASDEAASETARRGSLARNMPKPEVIQAWRQTRSACQDHIQ